MRPKLASALFLLIALGNPIYAQSQEDKISCEDKHKEGAEVCEDGKCKMEREMTDSNRELLPEKK